MSVARRSDGLLRRDGFVRIIELIEQSGGHRDTVVETMHVAVAAAKNRAHNTIEALRDIGAIKICPEGRCTSLLGSAEIGDGIRELLLEYYLGLLDRTATSGLFQLDYETRGLKVSNARLPGRAECYPFALLEFDIFRRDSLDVPLWTVADDLVVRFTDWLKQKNTDGFGGMFSLADLRKAQLAREAAGRIAEEWVLGWERDRLAGHIFVDAVRSVSDENAAAGFDILSFDGLRTLSHDRFFEVKG